MNGQIQYGAGDSLTSAPTRDPRRRPRVADAGRFDGTAPRSKPLAILGIGAALLAAMLVAMPRNPPGAALLATLGGVWLTLVLALTLPGRRERAGTELARRLAEFRHALNTLGDQPSRAQLEGMRQFARALELRDDEIAEELASIHASIAAIGLRQQLLAAPALADAPASLDGRCHFVCDARLGRRRSDGPGQLQLTVSGLAFHGTPDLSADWRSIDRVQRAGHDVIVSRRDHPQPVRFSCASLDDAAQAAVVADYLRSGAMAGMHR